MFTAIISLSKDTTYNISTITGEQPKGLIIDAIPSSGIIATAEESFLVSLIYKGHCVATIASIEQPKSPAQRF